MSFLCCGGGKKQYYEVTTEENGEKKTVYTNDIEKVKAMNGAQRVIRVEKSEYEELMKKYTGDKKWTDSSFPPGPKSLGHIENVPADCEWKRISEILSQPQLFDGKVQPKDVIQGSLGDCYFLSAIAALSEREHRIYNVFGNQKFNPNGIYKVQLRIDGIIKEVVIDDYVPVNKANRPLFCQPNKNEFWVLILEKAWAKANGSYANIAAGTPSQVLKAVTYAPCELKPVKQNEQHNMDNSSNLWGEIIVHANKQNPMCAGTKVDPSIQWEDLGLVPGHAYTLLDAIGFTGEGMRDERMVKLRNPWGQREWSGRGNQNDVDFWQSVPNSPEKSRFLATGDKGNDGVFYMTYEDFCHYFNEVHLCHLLDNPMYEVEQMKPNKKNGSLFSFDVKEAGEYMIELHQDTIRGEAKEKMDAGLNRSTIVLAKGENYEFVDGSLKYHEQDNTLKTMLHPGRYYVYTKVDPTIEKNLMPENLSVSCYSNSMVNISGENIKKHPDFFKKVFMTYARNNKRKEYEDGKMWISWKLFFEKGGYAYLAFGVQPGHNRKFVIHFDQKDFIDAGYTLKKPYKGKGKQTIEIKPGEEQVLVCRVKNGPLKPMKFPPPLDIQIDGV